MSRVVTRLLGIYDADGGIRGELAYVVGRVRRTAHCGLCDITHSPLRRKREWDAMAAGLGVPFDLLHRNEQERGRRYGGPLPAVLAEVDGHAVLLLGPAALDRAEGDVGAFRAALQSALETQSLLLPAR